MHAANGHVYTGQPLAANARVWLLASGLGLVLCAAVRVWLIFHSPLLSKDGAYYVEMAREALSDPAETARRYRAHPGYPVAIAGVDLLLRRLGAPNDLARTELAGRLVSLAAALVACAAAWQLARMAYDRRVAAVTLLTLAAARKWALLGSDVLSDALAISLELWAVVCVLASAGALRRHNRWSVPASVACGLCAGLAYLVRPEALLIVPVAAALLLATRYRFRTAWKPVLASLAAMLLALAACGLPYVLTTGRWTNKQDLIGPIGLVLPERCGGLPAVIDHPPAALAGWFSDTERVSTILIDKFFEAQHPLLACLTVACLAVHLLRRLRPRLAGRFAWPGPSWQAAFAMAAGALVFSAAVQSYYLRSEMLSYRYVMLPALLLSPLAAAAAVNGANVAAEALVRRGRRGAASSVLPLAIGAVLAAMLAHALREAHIGKAHHRLAGEFIAAMAGPEERLLTDDTWVLHYSRVGGCVMEKVGSDSWELANLIADSGATILALGERSITSAGLGDPRQLKSLGLSPVRRFDPDIPGKSEAVYVYRVEADKSGCRGWDFSAGVPHRWKVSGDAVVGRTPGAEDLEVTCSPVHRDYQLWSRPFRLPKANYRLTIEAIVQAGGLHLGCEDVETGKWIAERYWIAPVSPGPMSLDVHLAQARTVRIALSVAGQEECKWVIRRVTIAPAAASHTARSSPATRETISR